MLCAERSVFVLLPGPDRKRTEQPYAFQVTYSDPELVGSGCLMLWDVLGGRMTYQVALERDENGGLHFHCTCADAVFRAEAENRFCKHVRGLLGVPQAAQGNV